MNGEETELKYGETCNDHRTTDSTSNLAVAENENENQETLTAANNVGFNDNDVDDRASQDSREHVITTQPTATQELAYEDVYRGGNFGVTLGKVNQGRGLKWAFTHLGLSVLMLLLTIVGTALLVEYYNSNILRSLAIGFTWSNSLFGVLSAASAVFFFRRLTKLRRPYAFLMLVRFMAIFNWVFLLFSIIFVPIIIASKGEKAFTASTQTVAVIKAAYILLVAAVAIELVVSFSFVCSPSWSDACDSCSCCGACCIYTEGDEIAPGIPNPPSQERWEMVALALQECQSRLE